MVSLALGPSPEAGPSRPRQQTGSWVPLPYIHTGFVIHPHRPSTHGASITPKSPNFRNRFSWSGVPNSGDGSASNVQATPGNIFELVLDVGDELFAFEEYKCSANGDSKGETWYRGFVVPPATLSDLAPDQRLHPPYVRPRYDPQVVVGIFPASIVHIRPGAINDDGTLATAFEDAMRDGEATLTGRTLDMDHILNSTGAKLAGMPEEEGNEEEGYSLRPEAADEVIDVVSTPHAPKLASPTNGISRPNRPKSLLLDGRQTAPHPTKPQPPVPTITAGDSTVAGQAWPLVDEIACAIREWHERLPTYLANREYRLFDIVMQHIDCLFVGRRQILAQTHSEDELARVMRECVSRLVKCNVAQGLEVIVRSLKDGSVMVVDRDRVFNGTSWMSGITCYVYQVQLAYIDLIPLDTLFGKNSLLSQPLRPAEAAPFTRSLPAAGQNSTASGAFHHLFIDIKAFIANPCAAGETAELYFSLYNAADNHFVSEEFCLILNHLGSPARDAEQRLGRVRTLFTDLKPEDLSASVYLVCRIVRNGALRIKADTLAPISELGRRTSTLRGSRGNLLTENGTNRRASSIIDSTATDDSFSITSGFGVNGLQPVETGNTASTNVIDGRPSFRRPFGCAVLALPALQRLLEEGDSTGPGIETTMAIHVPRDEASFATMHEDIIHGRSKDFQTSNKAESIALSLKAFSGVYSHLLREHPGTLLEVPTTARLGFPDAVFPGATRNDFYIKLWSASFALLASSSGSIRSRKSTVASSTGDIQVSIEVRRPDGTVVQDALYVGGAGEPALSVFHSTVFHQNDHPTFGELLKISLAPKLLDCHLFLSFRSRGKGPIGLDPSELEKPFAFAYLPLLSPSSCITDGVHQLVLYRMEKNLQPSPKLYYDAPHTSADAPVLPDSAAKHMTPLRDRVTLRSYLCSNVHTTNDTLRSLLDRKELVANLDNLADALQMFSFVPEEEIAKFVPAILDALFGIMVSNLGERQDEIDDAIFQALVKVLSMTADRRFPNFHDVLNIYIDEYFYWSASSFHLLRAMRSTMADPHTKEYRSFIKVWHLIFRFVVRARSLDRAKGIGLDATSAHIEADFQRQIKAILAEIDTLVKSEDRTLIGTQTLAVQHYAEILPHLSQVFAPLEIAEIIISFADSLTDTKGSIAIHKLRLLLQVVRTTFDAAEARSLLVPAMIRWLRPHVGRYVEDRHDTSESQASRDGKRIKWMECNRLAVTVTAWMVNKLQEWHVSPGMEEDDTLRLQEEDNLEYCLTLLPSLVKSYIELNDPAALETVMRHPSSSSLFKQTPDVFPMSHPFTLFARLPPVSLAERQKHSDEAGLPPQSETFNCGLAETAVVVLSLIFASPPQNLRRWLSEMLEIEGQEACSTSLTSIFRFAKSVISFEAFPKQWLTLSLMAHGAIVRFLIAASEILEKEAFIPLVKDSTDFDVPLWTECLDLLCDICLFDALLLEEHTHQRRRAGWIIAGDLRETSVTLLVRLWDAIGWPIDETDASGVVPRYGGYQTRFTGLADKVLSLCLSGHDETCRAAVEILFSMIYAEYILDGKFDHIETAVFSKLDRLFSSQSVSSAEPAARAWFVTELRHVFETGPTIDEAFHAKVGLFLEEIELFIALLDNVRELPDTPAWADERAAATYQMLDFIRRIGRDGLYIRFVHQLKDIFLQEKKWLSAALTLKLHADMYDWTIGGDLLGECREGDLDLPAQTQFQRKEAIYRQCLEYLSEAQAFEHALELSEEMSRQHRQTTWNVERLSESLSYQADLWKKMASIRRHKPEYYRVAFYGDYRPAVNQGKEYIFRGEPWQQFAGFCDALQIKYPDATLHKSKMQPTPPVRAGQDQVIWVTFVSPEPDLSRPMFVDGVNENVQQYDRHNNVKTFFSLRPYKVHSPSMNMEDDGSGVMTWLEKTTLTTRDMFPGVLSRSEVVEVQYEHLSPINAAINAVKEATTNLKVQVGSRTRLPDVKQLGTAINGAVDSPVQGGVKLYRDTFLNERYISRHPDETQQVDALRNQILAYVRVIQQALSLHGKICRDSAFHEALRSHFMRSFPDEIAASSLSSPIDQQAGPLPPLDLEPTPNGLFAPTSPRASDVSTRPSITVTSPYALPPLREAPSPPHAKSLESVPATASPLGSPLRTKPVPNGGGRAPSPASARAKSPADQRPNPFLSIGSRLSFTGSNKSSDTVGRDDSLSNSGSVRKKSNRLSRLGDFMRKA